MDPAPYVRGSDLGRTLKSHGRARPLGRVTLTHTVMESHYNGLETFPVNNCMGQVWEIAEYNDAGEQVGTDYETELVYQRKNDEIATRIPLDDFSDIVSAMRQALNYVNAQRGSPAVPILDPVLT